MCTVRPDDILVLMGKSCLVHGALDKNTFLSKKNEPHQDQNVARQVTLAGEHIQFRPVGSGVLALPPMAPNLFCSATSLAAAAPEIHWHGFIAAIFIVVV